MANTPGLETWNVLLQLKTFSFRYAL